MEATTFAYPIKLIIKWIRNKYYDDKEYKIILPWYQKFEMITEKHEKYINIFKQFKKMNFQERVHLIDEYHVFLEMEYFPLEKDLIAINNSNSIRPETFQKLNEGFIKIKIDYMNFFSNMNIVHTQIYLLEEKDANIARNN